MSSLRVSSLVRELCGSALQNCWTRSLASARGSAVAAMLGTWTGTRRAMRASEVRVRSLQRGRNYESMPFSMQACEMKGETAINTPRAEARLQNTNSKGNPNAAMILRVGRSRRGGRACPC